MTTFSLSNYLVHGTGRLDGNGPVLISTPPQRWAYAVEFPAQRDAGPTPTALIIAVDLTVRHGVVGIRHSWSNANGARRTAILSWSWPFRPAPRAAR
jgi:hypothetical protein